MLEFTISFHYDNKDYKAGVLRLDNLGEVEYNVRPMDPVIVRKFGQQIRIFKKKGIYKACSRIELGHKDLFAGLTKAIQQYELNNEKSEQERSRKRKKGNFYTI